MKQFYELYNDNEKLSTLFTQLSWSNHLKLMSSCKTMEERIFYMNMCILERYMLSNKPAAPTIEDVRRLTRNVLLDNYVLDLLNLPDIVSEHDLQKSIVRKLKYFILEMGKEFAFIGEEYRVQVSTIIGLVELV
ncbi:hypothetical protein HMPREF9099_01432 [Lachnospiraceae bacterium oral taxon 082 str. F0431]|nr:hypothetical protein HMPREF9099_01432 [Lachnospiraceae bacterium oral taxon 082 str. F0431]